MTLFDYCVVLVVVLSMLLGWWRGLMYEILSLLSWLSAYFVALAFVADLSPHMPDVLGAEEMKTAAAFAALFLLTLILCGIAAWSLNKLARFFGLDWRTDGVMGAMFGLVRGVLLAVVLVLLAGFTQLPQQAAWREAALSQPLQQAALLLKKSLPDDVAKSMHY
ncbi:MAG TPA: CvpA family protein [Gallionellaceae bacterium]